MKAFKKFCSILELVFSVCVALGFTAVSVCVLVQILARYIPGFTAPWTDEMGRLCFKYTVLFGAPLAFLHNDYPYIDVFITMLHGKARHWANAVIYTLVTITSAVVFLNSRKFMIVGTKTLSTALNWRMSWFYGPIILCFGLSAVSAAIVVIREIVLAVKGDK